MFHVRFSLLLSAIVQMKNSLIKSLEQEAKERQPDLKMWTQVPVIDGLNPEGQLGLQGIFGDSDDLLTVYTPLDAAEEA